MQKERVPPNKRKKAVHHLKFLKSVFWIISSGGTGTRRLPGSSWVLHYLALPGPGRVLRQNVAGSE